MNFKELEHKVLGQKQRRLAIVGAHDRDILTAAQRVADHNIAEPVLIGDKTAIEREAAAAKIDLEGWNLVHEPEEESMVLTAMSLVREEKVEALMKGTVATPTLMRLALKNGLKRDGRLLSHLALIESNRLGRFVALTDSGIVPYPTFEQRIIIIRNAVEALRAIGIEQPKTAVLSSSEAVDPIIPCSVDAAKLTEMNAKGGALEDAGIIAGPMDFWSAVDPKTASKKRIDGPVAGHADIIHCPDVVSGNLLGKSAAFFGDDVRIGGCVVGGTVPVVLLSRASSADDKYCSILTGVACGSR